MLKKRLAMLGVSAAVVCAVMIPSVRGAAESALSIFRVGDTRTITITVSDIQDMITYYGNCDLPLKMQEGSDEQEDKMPGSAELSDKIGEAMSQVKTLSTLGDFTAFSFHLPTSLKLETPKLLAVDARSETLTLDTAKINAALQKQGATVTVDDSFDGTEITVNLPAAIAAEYQDVTLIATQSVYVDAPDAVMNSLWSGLISIPAISDDLRVQLEAIDPMTRDIYLPVIEGLGRETDLGSVTGYIYSASDLSQVMAMIPSLADSTMTARLQKENASALLWTKNGVLYCLAGQKTDSELSQIARSIH
ncbi:hypothetical protein [Papillibacter cinnamivorans]|uniref:DUF4367 domain-containing protein n=1 Tax=Papillibacter cinnamivorans DSM 12816 TaxID=1122930 RepID=A0A1W2CNR2_9FIRM|nr:hypothetical protein [Papillibacter cinnamivorans]SMC86841.1 hypothetical protein SAMN02745168_0126 [Papillibacter cinnamivorans DSM 12816]